jgi:hypothetical protein
MKLFRNLRQSLIKEGNVKKYIFYALGEIFLVVVGISLAFQLENWNDTRIERNNERSYYKNLKDQISDDKRKIESQITFNDNYRKQFRYANIIIEENDLSKVDTLGFLIRNLTQYSDFDRQGNIYETMVNSGEVKLLKNVDIVNGIRELEEKYLYINRIENIHYDAMMKYVIPTLTPNLKFSNAEIKKTKPFYSFEFQNLIISLLGVMDEKDRVYNSTIEEINIITKLINTELEK